LISIITVYNNKSFFEENILATLRNQTAQYELIALDNTNKTFRSATIALNHGASKATGDFLMFIHQDMRLLTDDALAQIENHLHTLPDLGAAGVIGVSHAGITTGCILNTYECLGKPFVNPVEVQTLDECMLIIPKKVFQRFSFDEVALEGWHLYGVDYCLTALEAGLRVYVLPVLTHHFSLGTNYDGLLNYQKLIWKKHLPYFPAIYTTCGKLTFRALFRMWFKQNLLDPLRGQHPKNFFYHEFIRQGTSSMFVLIPPASFPDQSFDIKEKILTFSSNLSDFGTLCFDTIILSDLQYLYNKTNAFSIINEAEKLGKRIFISYRIIKGSKPSFYLTDLLTKGYKLYNDSKKWKIYTKFV